MAFDAQSGQSIPRSGQPTEKLPERLSTMVESTISAMKTGASCSTSTGFVVSFFEGIATLETGSSSSRDMKTSSLESPAIKNTNRLAFINPPIDPNQTIHIRENLLSAEFLRPTHAMAT